MKKKEKYISKALNNINLVYIICTIIVLIIIGIIAIAEINNHGKYVEISYSELKQKINNDESFILFIGSNTCAHCADYKNLILSLDENVTFYYIDLDKVSKEEGIWLENKYHFSGTPATCFIEKGDLDPNGYFEGTKYDILQKKLIKFGYMKGK